MILVQWEVGFKHQNPVPEKKSLPCGTLEGDVSITGVGKIRGLARGKLLDIFIIASFITKSVATIWWKRQMQSKTNDGD